jgi:hypothetical protein
MPYFWVTVCFSSTSAVNSGFAAVIHEPASFAPPVSCATEMISRFLPLSSL